MASVGALGKSSNIERGYNQLDRQRVKKQLKDFRHPFPLCISGHYVRKIICFEHKYTAVHFVKFKSTFFCIIGVNIKVDGDIILLLTF